MNIKPELQDLKQIYDLYKLFWKEWTIYKYSGLNDKDVSLVAFYLKIDFDFYACDNLSVYDSRLALARLNEKLRANYCNYQDWVIKKFQFTIIKDCLKNDFEINYSMPIKKLNVDVKLSKILLRFNFNNLQQLFGHYTDETFRDKVAFGHILLYLHERKKLNQHYYAAVQL